MALSANVGASALGLKIAACTASLNFETFASIRSAKKLSETSQPVSSVSAPKLAPPAMKRRRARSGINFVASLTSSCLSTPGIRSERSRPMTYLLELASDDHGAQAFRHQHRQRDMHDQERDDRRHADKVDVTRDVIAAEQRGQILQLHRLPDRKHRQHDHAGIEQLLHVIVSAEVVMRELEGQRRLHIRDHAVRGDRQQFLAEAAGGNTQREIDQALDHQEPHRREMPEQRAAEPATQRDRVRKAETEQRRSVVDLPSRHDHQDHRHRIDPVHNADPRRLNDLCRGGYGMLVAGYKAGHGGFLAFPWLFRLKTPIRRIYAGSAAALLPYE